MEKAFFLPLEDFQIPCRVTVPDSGNVNRVILGVHGFGGSMQDDIQVALAQEMEFFGSATVRFDFPAHGQSSTDSEAFTLDNCVQTLLAVARWVNKEFPDAGPLCIFATGFGAYITLLCLEQLPQDVKLVVQTPAVMMHETLLQMLRTTRQTLRAIDRMVIAAPRPFAINYRFFKDLERNIVLTSHRIPMLILHGEEDSYIQVEHIQHFHRINENSKLVIIPGASHRFEEDGAWDMVLDLTRDWFDFEQVLLSDWS